MTTTHYIQYCVVDMENTRSRFSLSLIHQSNINRDDGSDNTKKIHSYFLTTWRLTVIQTEYITWAPTSQRTQSVFITKITQLILFREMLNVHIKYHMKHTGTHQCSKKSSHLTVLECIRWQEAPHWGPTNISRHGICAPLYQLCVCVCTHTHIWPEYGCKKQYVMWLSLLRC